GQLAWYRAMEAQGELAPINSLPALRRHLEQWQNPFESESGNVSTGTVSRGAPIGYILSLEGADSLIGMHHLEIAYNQGLRAVGPAHYGPGTYAQGTNATGGIGIKGRQLLREMARLGIILDVTHLCDESFWEAMDAFEGRLWASHSNCRALVPHQRQLAD